jgi:hypothetical protein
MAYGNRSNLLLTYAKYSEKGRPRSRANAHVKRETDAKILKSPTMLTKMMKTIRTFVAATELVAPKNTVRMGKLVELRTASTSPSV